MNTRTPEQISADVLREELRRTPSSDIEDLAIGYELDAGRFETDLKLNDLRYWGPIYREHARLLREATEERRTFMRTIGEDPEDSR